jgi:hypothetical protein
VAANAMAAVVTPHERIEANASTAIRRSGTFRPRCLCAAKSSM